MTLWRDAGYKLFLSHRAEHKREVAALAEELRPFGVSAFVAHEDIRPTDKWLDAIDSALMSMDALLAILTKDFHDSEWTDQEIGYALGRGVPVISVALECQPKGFVGRFQSLRCSWKTAALEITKVLFNQPGFVRHYCDALKACDSFDAGNALGAPLAGLDRLALEDAERLIEAFNENSEIRGAFAFNGKKPEIFGPGLVNILRHFHPNQFVANDRKILKIIR